MEGPADVRRRAGQEVEPFGTDCVRCVRDICLYFEGNREPQKHFRQGRGVINFDSDST